MTCEVVQGDRSRRCRGSSRSSPGRRSRPLDTRYPDPHADAPPPADMELPGTVKFYDPTKSFGFPRRALPEGRRIAVHGLGIHRSREPQSHRQAARHGSLSATVLTAGCRDRRCPFAPQAGTRSLKESTEWNLISTWVD